MFDSDLKVEGGKDIIYLLDYNYYNLRYPKVIGAVGISSGFLDLDLLSVDGFYKGLLFDDDGFIINRTLEKNDDIFGFVLWDNVFNNSFSDYLTKDNINYTKYLR